MPYNFKDPNDATLEKWYRVADEYILNGYDGAKAYQKIYPNAGYETARRVFYNMKKNPQIASYIKKKREEALEMQSIDVLRVTEEMAKIAFCETGDKYIPASVKAKMLEVLRNALIEDEEAKKNEALNKIIVTLEE